MSGTSVNIWDLPVRICHWSFVILIPALWWTAEEGEMGWHMRLGIVLLGLAVFRVLWGFAGSSTARFASFVRGPATVLAYLRSMNSPRDPIVGHNPLGGWSVLALLGAMLLQTGLGLFSGDPYDGATGPLNHLVGVMTADSLTEWHESFFNVLLALVGIHLLAVLFYLAVKRDNLVHPMVTGRRAMPGEAGGMQPVPAWRFLLCLLAAALFALWLWIGAPPL